MNFLNDIEYENATHTETHKHAVYTNKVNYILIEPALSRTFNTLKNIFPLKNIFVQ